jgi:hypothetical protein
MVFLITIFSSIFPSACSVSPERHRDARLMPTEIARNIIDRYMGVGWAENPRARAYGAHLKSPLCIDELIYSLSYEKMIIGWDDVPGYKGVLVQQRGLGVGFLCGGVAGFPIVVRTSEEVVDLIDAFISLGAKVSTR